MRAVVTTGAVGGVPVLADRPDPEPGAGEILLRVRAAGLNNADLMQVKGHYPAPPDAPQDMRALMVARGRIQASTLRSRPLEQKADAARRVEAHVLPLMAAGRVRVPVLATYPLEEAAAAYARFAEPGKLGKIVLTID